MAIKNPYSYLDGVEQFTWCYNSYSPNAEEFRICFQWLRFQGSEFHVAFRTHQEMVVAAGKLRDAFAPDYLYTPLCSAFNGRDSLWPYRDAHGVWCYDFYTTDRTLDPDDIRTVLGKDVFVVVTPTGNTSKKVLEKFADYGLSVSNDTPVWKKDRKSVYFITRQVGLDIRYLKTKAGRLRTWTTREKAEAVLGKLSPDTLL
ncbi:MAG: hypothetical protein AAB895_00275 [Patescibacteria group bacterium]